MTIVGSHDLSDLSAEDVPTLRLIEPLLYANPLSAWKRSFTLNTRGCLHLIHQRANGTPCAQIRNLGWPHSVCHTRQQSRLPVHAVVHQPFHVRHV
jgi:hypothetical protein